MQDRMGMTTVLNAAGVDKDRFIDYTDKNPATYKVRLKGSSNRYHAAHVKKTRKYIYWNVQENKFEICHIPP